MELPKDIIQRCHQQHKAVLRQRQTVVTPALYKHIPYHFNVRCARATLLTLDALEHAHISFMPIGRAPENEDGPRDFGGDRFSKRQGIGDWLYRRLFESWGIQIYTGIPSALDGANWHDFYFTYQAICAAPDAVLTCIKALVMTATTPLLALTKSGGLRFSCRIPDYLHSSTDAAKSYIYKHAPTPEDPHHRDVYLEIRGENGYSRWDTRYEILLGNLLDPPVIAKEILFVPLDTLRAVLHEPYLLKEKRMETALEPTIAAPASLGSDDLDLAKAAFLKRGFSYLREDIGFHHWIPHNSEGDDTHASLWEDQGIVWVRTATPPTAPPTSAMPITDMWDNTDITPRLPVTDKMIAIQQNKLSPLAIKTTAAYPSPWGITQEAYATPEENADEIRSVLEKKTRVLGVISEAAPGTDVIVESYLATGGATCLNIANRKLAEVAEERYQALNLPSFARWRARMYRWQQAKDTPVDERMANPFQHGNLCEDPERCRALEAKGGSPHESICPKCPVYSECQERGYLSQPMALQRAKAQILPTFQIFLDPRRSEPFERIFESADGTERICLIDEDNIGLNHLFIECILSTDVLKKWTVSWRGRALGNYAKALLNVLQPESEPDGSAIARIRAATDGFQQHEEEIIQQMCHVNVRGKVMAREPVIDTENGKELARFTIEFENGASACIPVDTDAEDRLKEKGLPCFPLDFVTRDAVGASSRESEFPPTKNNPSSVGAISESRPSPLPTEDIEIPMSMAQAIALGVLDTETVQTIQEFPTVYRNPNWTLWHQLKRFFAHYKRDADAPMRWNATILRFGMPPMLHPDIKRLLLISPTVPKDYLQRVFPNDEIEIVRPKPTAWVPGTVFFSFAQVSIRRMLF